MKKSTKLILLFAGIIVCVAGAFAGCSIKDLNIKYQLEFESNGGTLCKTVKSSDTASIKVPDNPTRSNYIFDGWFWDDGEWEKPFTVNSILDQPVSEYMNLTVYAKWKGVDVNVTLKNFDGDSDKQYTIEYGSLYELPEPLTTFEDKDFNGWAFSGESSVATDAYGNSLVECDFLNAEFTPVWKEGKVTVTFDGNGGEVKTYSKTKVVWKGEKFGSMPSAVLDKYTFDGWYTEPDGGVKIESDDVVEFTGAVTLYAHYIECKDANVIYDGNGATSGSMKPETLVCGMNYFFPFSSFYRKGFTFSGWEYDGKIYQPLDTVVLKEGDNTVKAVWKGMTVKILFYGGAKGVKGEMQELTYVNGTGFTFPECAFIRDYYAFDGWEFYYNNRTYTYATGEKIADFGDSRIIELSATWRAARYNVKIKNDINEPDSQAKIIIAECNKFINIAKYIDERKGYTSFIEIQNGEYSGESFGCEFINLSRTDGDEIIAVVRYKENSYELRYPVTQSSYISFKLTYEEEHIVPECLMVNDGYVLKGWQYRSYYVEDDVEDGLYLPGDVIKSITAKDGQIIEVTPVWRAVNYTLKIHSNDGRDDIKTIECTYGEHEDLPENWLSDTDNYKFIGYRVGKNVFGTYKNVDVCNEDGAVVDAYALWAYKYAGAGTKADPYIIDNAEGLQNLDDFLLADKCFTISGFPTRMFFKLAADIDMTGKKFVPVGACGKQFYGTFDGGGHTISNLNIDIQNADEYVCIGFFADFRGDGNAYNSYFGEIKNLTLENPTVTADLTGVKTVHAGILAGQAYWTRVSNCAVTGGSLTLTNGEEMSMTSVGGMIGGCDGAGSSNDCYFEGEINVSAYYAVIKILGLSAAKACAVNARISAVCTSKADIYLAGSSSGYAVVQADIMAQYHEFYCDSASYYSDKSKLMVNGEVKNESIAGVLTADANLKDPVWIAENLPALRTVNWTIEGGYPILGKRTLDTIEIGSAEELLALSGKALTERYILTANIDMSGKQWSAPLVYGEFDGNGYTVSGFSTTEVNDSSSGFFNTNYGVIKNLRLIDVLITVQSDGSNVQAGGIVGSNLGMVAYCKVQGQIAAVVNGGHVYLGGIAGISAGEIYGCYTDCKLEGSAIPSKERGVIQIGGVQAFVYGIAYQIDGTVSSCYTRGDYTASAYYKVNMGGVSLSAENSFSLANFNFNSDVKKNEVLPVGGRITGCSSQKVNGVSVNGVSEIFYNSPSYITDTVGFKSFVSAEKLVSEPYACWKISSDGLPKLYYED